MKRLQEHEPYPTELWDQTEAPAWSAERVWQQIEEQQAPPRHRAWWLWWGCLLLLLFGGLLGWNQSNSPTSIEPPVEQVIEAPSAGITPPTREQQTVDERREQPATVVPKATEPESLPVQELTPLPPAAMKLPADSVTRIITLPIAQEQLPAMTPVLPLTNSFELLPESVVSLPADTRSGTKLKLRIPEIPAAEARQGAFAKRLWQQYKRLNIEGEIDWVELGIQPNGDGTFSILPPTSKASSKPN